MSHYYGRGDHYYGAGDYYRGRGDFFGFLKGVAGIASHILPGPLGTVAGLLAGTGKAHPSLPPPPAIIPGVGLQRFTDGGPVTQTGLININRPPPPVYDGGGGGGGMATGTSLALCNVKGHHLNKHGYYTKHGYVMKGTACVRNRRMNVANPRALRRAVRRAQGFVKLAMRTIHLIHPKKPGRFGGFKKRKKR